MRVTIYAAVLLALTWTLAFAKQGDRVTARDFVRIDLGAMTPGGVTFAYAINNRNEVVGEAFNVGSPSGAFFWTQRDGFQLIADNGPAIDINDRGQVVGEWATCQACERQGFVWSAKDGFQNLGSFFPDAINDKGEFTGGCQGQACVVGVNGTVTLIPVSAHLTGINQRGDVVGNGLIVENPSREDPVAFKFSRDGVLTLPDFTNSRETSAFDINNRGTVVGFRVLVAEQTVVATRWTSSGRSSLPFPSAFFAVNESEQAVGERYSPSGVATPFLWDPVRDVIDLATPALERSGVATDINDRGVVAGHSTLHSGATHAILWRSVQPAGG